MSAMILGSVSHEDCKPCAFHAAASTYAGGHLGSWSLQRLPHQNGRWYVSIHIRGLFVSCLAVQDDFGDLQMVAV